MKYILAIILTAFCFSVKAEPKDSIDFETIKEGIWGQPKSESPLWEYNDFSKIFHDYILYDARERHATDVTKDLRGFDLDVVELFSSYNGRHEYATPQNGVFGPLNKRLQVYISNYFKTINSQEVEIYGATKRGLQIRHFTGSIHIERIIEAKDTTIRRGSDTTEHTLIATFDIKEDKDLEGSGEIKGTYCAKVKVQVKYDFLHNTIRREIWTNDDAEGHYGYSNRNFVGVWTSYNTGEQLKAIWGDNTLPFPLDFKIGYGEQLNEKYMSSDWASYLNGDSEIETVYDDEGNETGVKQKDEWWKR